jgi:hypothetical protein
MMRNDMSAKKHNKKKNVGLLYEFLIGETAQASIESREKDAATTIDLIHRHFRPGTALYEEWCLINALMKTSTPASDAATSLLSEARRAARERDVNALELGRKKLLSDIQKTIKNPEMFFDRPIDEYKDYATIGILLHEWRSRTPDIALAAQYEGQLIDRMSKKHQRVNESVDQVNHDPRPGVNRLVMKIMMKKLNERYNGVFDEQQRTLVRSYALSAIRSDATVVSDQLNECRNNIITRIDESLSSDHELGGYVLEKLKRAKQQLLSEDTKTPDDQQIVRFMLYVNLMNELGKNEEVVDDAAK